MHASEHRKDVVRTVFLFHLGNVLPRPGDKLFAAPRESIQVLLGEVERAALRLNNSSSGEVIFIIRTGLQRAEACRRMCGTENGSHQPRFPTVRHMSRNILPAQSPYSEEPVQSKYSKICRESRLGALEPYVTRIRGEYRILLHPTAVVAPVPDAEHFSGSPSTLATVPQSYAVQRRMR